MKKNNLTNEWSKFKAKNLQTVKDQMQFDYGEDEATKDAMAEALTFWLFSRGIADNEERRNLIKDLFITDNKSLKLVFMIESLPDKVWRKLLWKQNMDFMSFESFLRRIDKAQCGAIEKSYAQLFFHEQVPEVMKRTVWNKVKNFFKRISSDSLLKEDYVLENRNQSKPAWAFNLLGLDFGFSLYYLGDNDDTKITNKSWTRFLSIKNHINDFVVDQEQGKYWWLYRTARSNYVINSKKNVSLKSHICPGFWATFLLHLIFWIGSPVLLVSTLIWLGIDGPHWYLWIPAIPGLITPLWLFAATIKLLDILLNKITKNIKFSKPVKWVLKTIGIMILVALALAITGVITFVIGYMIAKTTLFFGNFLSVLFVASVWFYLINGIIAFVRMIREDYDCWKIYKKIPTWIRRLASVSIIASAICIIDKISPAVIKLVVSMALSVWSFIKDYPYLCIWFIICAGFVWIVIWLISLEQKNEKAFAKAEKIITYVVAGFILSTLVFLGTAIIKDFRFMPDTLKYAIYGIIGIMLIFGGSLWILRDKVNMTTIHTLEWADERYAHLVQNISGWYEKSPWWFGTRRLFLYIDDKISADTIDKLTDRVIALSQELFYHNDRYRYWFICRIIPFMTEELLNKIKKEKRNILSLDNDWEKEFYIRRILLGIENQEVVKQLEVVKQHKKKVKTRAKNFATIITYPWEKITQFFGTLKDIWDLLNKRCPTNAQKKLLN